MTLSALALIGLLFAAAPQDAAQTKQTDKVDPTVAIIKQQLPSYPLDTCIVSDEELGDMGDPINLVVDGKLVRLCCKGCIKPVKKDPAKYIAKVNKAVVKAQLASYPLETCPVSGEKLGSMGDPIEHVEGTRLVRFCCKGCVKAFTKDPAKYMEGVDAALMAAQRATYPVKACLISGEDLGSMGEPVELLYGTRLVRLCCKGCVKGFRKDPAAFIAKLDAATPKVEKSDKAGEHGEHGDHGDHGKGGKGGDDHGGHGGH